MRAAAIVVGELAVERCRETKLNSLCVFSAIAAMTFCSAPLRSKLRPRFYKLLRADSGRDLENFVIGLIWALASLVRGLLIASVQPPIDAAAFAPH